MADDRLQWNLPAVTSERFDDEIVIVNFDSGKYHSIQGAGVDIWEWLKARPTLAELLDLSRTVFNGDAPEVDAAVRTFVAELQREGLVVTATDAPLPGGPAEIPPSDRVPFRSPILSTFSDMQELLWLDPIHEVDEAGWPVARDGAGIDE